MSKKNKQLKPDSKAIAGSNTGERKVLRSPDEERTSFKKISIRVFLIVLLSLLAGKKVKEENVVEEKPKRLTLKEKAKIVSETKAANKALAATPPGAFASIIPAPKLYSLSLISLCKAIADGLTRISAIPEFSTCSPSVSFVSDIYDNLFALVSIATKDLTSSQKIDIKVYAKQLRQNFMLIAYSCAALSLGNIKLFGLTSIATRKKGYVHKKQLGACVFKLSAKSGKGKIKVVIEKMAYAKNYTIFYGVGDYDKATWNTKTGTATQIISDFLVPGVLTNFFVIANGYAGPGITSDPIGIYVPYN